jgi:hypothetical protein
MKISEATLGNMGDVVTTGAKNVYSAAKSGEGSGSGGSFVSSLLSPERIRTGVSVQDKMAENNFISDFISKANQAIENAIKGGYVDPTAQASDNLSLSSAAPSPAPAPAPSPAPAPAPSPAPAPAPSPAPAQTTTQQPQTFTFGREKYTKGPKGWVDSKGKAADPNVVKLLDRAASEAGSTQQAPANTTPPQPKADVQPNVTPAPTTKKAGPQQGRSTVPQGGGKVPGYTSQSPNAVRKRQARATAKAAPAQPAQPAAKQPRQTVGQKAQGYLKQQALKKQAAPGIVRESSYSKLNRLFESYMAMLENQDAPQEQTTMLSIPDFLAKEFLPDYLGGIPYQKAEQQFQALLKKIPSTWAKGRSKNELTTMAKLAYSLAPKQEKPKAAAGPSASPGSLTQPNGSEQQTIKGTDWGSLGKNL